MKIHKRAVVGVAAAALSLGPCVLVIPASASSARVQTAATAQASAPAQSREATKKQRMRALPVRVAADLLGMTPKQVRASLRQGQSLSDLAAARQVSRDDLVQALVNALVWRIEAAVESGRVTREKADARIADVPRRVGNLVDRTWSRSRS